MRDGVFILTKAVKFRVIKVKEWHTNNTVIEETWFSQQACKVHSLGPLYGRSRICLFLCRCLKVKTILCDIHYIV